MENKSDLRARAKLIRNGLDIKTISQKLCEKISKTEEFKLAQNIMIYFPLKNEINLLALLDYPKKFYLPRMKYLNLDVCPYKKGDKLNNAKFGVKEPTSSPVSPKILDLIIVPALMADKNGYRLGYGKGYYDRLLVRTQAKTIVCVPKELLVDNLPTEPHDKKIDIIFIP